MTAIAVIVAAGKGERFGDAGKVMSTIAGRPCLAWTLDAFQNADSVDGIIIVVGDHTRDAVTDLTSSGEWLKVQGIVPGGASRQYSMANGVRAVPADADVILVHDAARPLTPPALINESVRVAREHGGAILAAPITDTVKQVVDEEVSRTIDRSTLWGAQTPQTFRADMMREMAHHAFAGDIAFTDEASLAEVLGYPVRIVRSDSTNLKITHPHDIAIAEAIILTRENGR